MTFLAPVFAWAALAAVPIVLLYLLKMKRQERVISSTLLWQQTIKDLEANVPFQKLRASLLLVLQLAILALLVLALMRPAVPSRYQVGERSVLVIDTSASMLADDTDAGTRLAKARQLAGGLIDSLEEGQRMMILCDAGRVTDGFLTDKSRLHQALDEVEASESESDCARALQLAYSILTAGGEGGATAAAAGGQRGRIFLISDGAGLALPTDAADLGDLLTYYTVGGGADNAGIVGLSFRRPADPAKKGELFVSVTNASPQDRSLAVSLRRRDETALLDAKELILKAGQTAGVTFSQAFEPGGYVVKIGAEDVLALDNEARVVLGENRPLRVLLATAGRPELERVLGRADQVETAVVAPDRFAPADEVIDLYVLDSFVPAVLPQGRTTIFLTPPEAVGAFKPAGVIERPAIFDWNRDDPVMRFVSMRDVRLADDSAVRLAADPRMVSLVSGLDAPLVAWSQAGPVRHYCIAFDMSRSSWPKASVSFPIFWGNLLDEARTVRRIGQALIGKTGQLWPLGPAAAGQTTGVEAPGGRRYDVVAGEAAADFRQTDRAGFYAAEIDGRRSEFALNLVSLRESDIAPQPELRGLGQEIIPGETRLASGTCELWPALTAAALLLLLVEWYVYHRRIG